MRYCVEMGKQLIFTLQALKSMGFFDGSNCSFAKKTHYAHSLSIPMWPRLSRSVMIVSDS